MESINHNPIPQMDEALSRLRRISFGLRSVGWGVFLATLANIAATAICLARHSASQDLSFWRPLSLWSCLAAILFVVFYEYSRRQGNVLFEEISDELEWNVNGAKLSEGGSLASARPEVNVRIILRMFARATDLPLFPSQYGPVIYLLLNLILVFIGYLFTGYLLR